MALPIPNSSSVGNENEENISLPSLPELPDYSSLFNKDSKNHLTEPEIPNSVSHEATASLPTINEKAEVATNIDPNYRIDERTGKKYRILPKSEYDAEGNPILQIPDFDADNLNSEADEFLAHLRVTPTKNEIIKMREEREKRLSNAG